MPDKSEDTTLGDIGSWYHKYLAPNPAAMMATHGLIGAGLGGLVAPWIVKQVLPKQLRGSLDESKLPWVLGGLGAAAGMVPGAYWAYWNAMKKNRGWGGLTDPRPFGEKRAYYDFDNPTIGIRSSINNILNDPFLPYAEKMRTISAVQTAGILAGKQSGLVTTDQVYKGAIGAGLGAIGGRILGVVLGLPRTEQIGMIAGAMYNAGLIT